MQGNPKKSLPKTQFSAISLLCFFLSKKEAGFQGAAPLGRDATSTRRALPRTRLRNFLKKVSLKSSKTLNGGKLRFPQAISKSFLPKTKFLAVKSFLESKTFFSKKVLVGIRGQRPRVMPYTRSFRRTLSCGTCRRRFYPQRASPCPLRERRRDPPCKGCRDQKP